MSSLQISYPFRLQLQTLSENKSLSLKKGPQREKISLEGFSIKLIKSGYALQPVIQADSDGIIRSLSLWIPLSESWHPLIKKEEKSGYSSFFLNNAKQEIMQIYMGSKDQGLLHIELCGKGKTAKITWLLDSRIKAGEDLVLKELHMSIQDNKIEPARYGLKEPSAENQGNGRFFTPGPRPSLELIRQDVKRLSEKKCTFDFYLFDYGAASAWGDWDKPASWIGDRMTEMADAVRPLGARAGIRLSPLTCARNSAFYKTGHHLLIGKGKPLKYRDSRGSQPLFPLDITRPEVRDHIDRALNYHVSRGFRVIHLDHLELLFSTGDWFDPGVTPQQRLQMLIDIIKPFSKQGVRFSQSGLPLVSQLEHFDVVFADLNQSWKGYSGLLNLAVCLKNPPLLSLGCLRFAPAGRNAGREERRRKIYHHTQNLLNGPALLADKTEDLDDELIEAWKRASEKKKTPLLPLDISEIGLKQNVLLLLNRQKMVAILNLDSKTRIVSIKEGTLSGGRGFSPSETTSLKSQELILKMFRESSHFFRI